MSRKSVVKRKAQLALAAFIVVTFVMITLTTVGVVGYIAGVPTDSNQATVQSVPLSVNAARSESVDAIGELGP